MDFKSISKTVTVRLTRFRICMAKWMANILGCLMSSWVYSPDAGGGGVLCVCETDAGLQVARTLQAQYGWAGALHVPVRVDDPGRKLMLSRKTPDGHFSNRGGGGGGLCSMVTFMKNDMWMVPFQTNKYRCMHFTIMFIPQFFKIQMTRQMIRCNPLHIFYDSVPQEQLPELHVHFQAQSFHTSMYASSWFLTIFLTSFPLPVATRIFDIFMCEVS